MLDVLIVLIGLREQPYPSSPVVTSELRLVPCRSHILILDQILCGIILIISFEVPGTARVLPDSTRIQGSVLLPLLFLSNIIILFGPHLSYRCLTALHIILVLTSDQLHPGRSHNHH